MEGDGRTNHMTAPVQSVASRGGGARGGHCRLQCLDVCSPQHAPGPGPGARCSAFFRSRSSRLLRRLRRPQRRRHRRRGAAGGQQPQGATEQSGARPRAPRRAGCLRHRRQGVDQCAGRRGGRGRRRRGDEQGETLLGRGGGVVEQPRERVGRGGEAGGGRGHQHHRAARRHRLGRGSGRSGGRVAECVDPYLHCRGGRVATEPTAAEPCEQGLSVAAEEVGIRHVAFLEQRVVTGIGAAVRQHRGEDRRRLPMAAVSRCEVCGWWVSRRARG